MGIREIEIGGQKLVIHELEDVYDSVTGRALTGSWLWNSALFFSHWMAQLNFDFRGKTVLELGAGAGLPGLAAARLGARRVVLTDLEPLLHGLKRNVEANGLGDRVEVSQLAWGSDELPSRLNELGEPDLVLMSDVFFDASEMAALAKTLKRVCGEATRVWAACEVRAWTSDVLNELVSEGIRIFEFPSQLSLEFSSSVTNCGSDVFAVFHLVPTETDQDNELLEE